jgi:hypothetical protein
VLVHQPDGLETVHPRHEDIDDQQIEVFRLDDIEPCPTIVGHVDFEPFTLEDHLYGQPYRPIIIYDKDACHSRVP